MSHVLVFLAFTDRRNGFYMLTYTILERNVGSDGNFKMVQLHVLRLLCSLAIGVRDVMLQDLNVRLVD